LVFLGGFFWVGSFGWVFSGGFFIARFFYCQPWFEAMLRDVLLSLVKLMFGGCGGSQEDLLAIQAACLKHIVLTVPDLVQAENRRSRNFSVDVIACRWWGRSFFASRVQVPSSLLGD
jgi:hypothetical protein